MESKFYPNSELNLSGINVFQHLAKEAPEQLLKFAMNLEEFQNNPDKAVKNWEKKEYGSLKGVMDAYSKFIAKITDQNYKFTVDDLKSIHETAIKNTTYPGKLNFSQLRCFRGEKFTLDQLVDNTRTITNNWSTSFTIYSKTLEEEGLENLVRLYPNHRFTGAKVANLENKEEITIDTKDKDWTEKFIEYLKQPKKYICSFLFFGYDGDLTEDEMNNACRLYGLEAKSKAIKDNLSTSEQETIANLRQKFQSNLEKQIINTLSNFYEKIHSEQENDHKLFDIAEFIQKSEHIHPFYDANCRTFCIVLLNLLLMQNGFAPTLIDDPNKFDGYSIKGLVSLIKEGIQNTNKLCSYIQTPSKEGDENWMEVSAENKARYQKPQLPEDYYYQELVKLHIINDREQ